MNDRDKMLLLLLVLMM